MVPIRGLYAQMSISGGAQSLNARAGFIPVSVFECAGAESSIVNPDTNNRDAEPSRARGGVLAPFRIVMMFII